MGARLIEADVVGRRSGRRRPRRGARVSSPRAATSSSSRRATASAAGSGTPRSAARRTSSAASGSRRTSRGCTRSSPSSGSSSSPRIARATTSTSTRRAARAGIRATRPACRSAEERALKEGDAKLDALAKELDPEAPWEHPRARELDTITFDEWLRAEVADEAARENLRSYLADGFLTKPAHSFSLLQGLWAIAGAGGTYELFAPEQCLAYRVVGGSQLIPIRLAEELGERVVLGAPVRAIRWRDGGVEVDAGARRRLARARRSSPSRRTSTATIRFEPALPAWRMRLQQAISQGSVTKFLAVYDEPFWRADGLSGEGFAPYGFVRELYDNSPPSASVGVLCTFLPGEQAELAARMSPDARRAAILEGMAAFVGPRGARARPTTSRPTGRPRSGRAARTRRPSGSAASRASAPTCAGPVGPIHWACSDIAGFGHMHMEGGVRSGEAAAAAVSLDPRSQSGRARRGRAATRSGHALQLVLTRRRSNASPEPATRSFTVLETSTSPGAASAATRAPTCDCEPADLVVDDLAPRPCGRPRVPRGPARALLADDRACARDRSRRAVERSRRSRLLRCRSRRRDSGRASLRNECVMLLERGRASDWSPRRHRRAARVDDVREQHGRQHPIRSDADAAPRLVQLGQERPRSRALISSVPRPKCQTSGRCHRDETSWRPGCARSSNAPASSGLDAILGADAPSASVRGSTGGRRGRLSRDSMRASAARVARTRPHQRW